MSFKNFQSKKTRNNDYYKGFCSKMNQTFQNSTLEFNHDLQDYLISDIPRKCLFEEVIQEYYGNMKHSPQTTSYDYLKGEEFSKLKEKGNSIYKSIFVNMRDLVKTEDQLSQVSLYYSAAASKAQTHIEIASIKKNLAVVHFKLVQCRAIDEKTRGLFSEGVKSLQTAIQYMLNEENIQKEWVTKLIDVQNESLKYLLNKILSEKKGKKNYEKVVKELKQLYVDIDINLDLEINLLIKKKMIEVMEEQIVEYKKCDKFLQAESQQIKLNSELFGIYKLTQISRNEKIKFFFENRYQRIDESIEEYQAQKYLQLGNQMYREVQNNRLTQSSFKLESCEQIWECVDAYKAAIKLYEGKFMNIEAESYFMIGQIYMELLGKQSQRVHEYIRNAIALDFNSSQVMNREWYIQAQNLMKILQSDVIEAEQVQFNLWKSNNQLLINSIEEQKEKGCPEFIKWITKQHLPSNKQSFTLNEEEFKDLKKLLKKVMLLFHGDKIVNESQHFKYISKQIMLNLTEFFEKFK